MDYLVWLARLAGIIMVIAYIPQQIKIYKTKSSKGLSLQMFLLVFLSILIYEVYAGMVKEPVFLFTNTISVVQTSIMLGLIWRYKDGTNECN